MSNNRFKITEKKIISSTANFYDKPILLYPNPISDKIVLEFGVLTPKEITLIIYDALGRKVVAEKRTPRHHLMEIDTSHLKNGVYLLKGKIGTQIFSKQFIVNE